jgi:hypothetical protein
MSLFLQTQVTHTITTTELIGAYIGIAGSLFASLVAAAASFRASSKASSTAREVVMLSSRSAQELKDKEFRNDYYKKIIDRRLTAYESLEQLVAEFSKRRIIDVITSVGKGTHEIYAFFASDKDYDTFFKLVNELLDRTLWFSVDLKKEVLNLQNKLAEIGNGFGTHIGQEIGAERLRVAGINHDYELKKLRKKIIAYYKNELIEIQHIDKFFEGLSQPVED